jgi:hypothetical protein
MLCRDNREATRGCELLSGAVVVGEAERCLVGEAELSLIDAVAARRRSALERVKYNDYVQDIFVTQIE